MHSPHYPAFIIGVTGHMDIPEEDVAEVEARFRVIIKTLRSSPESADTPGNSVPAWWPMLERRRVDGTGDLKLRPMPGLGLQHQRIILLSSMAPGADTIAARVALAEDIEVRAPLPFPADLYPQSSTFTGAAAPTTSVGDYESLVGAPSSLIDAFPVLLASDQELSERQRQTVFQSDLQDPERRHLRYRAAGEYVSSYCHLLIALFQPDETGGGSSASSQTIVDIARTGPTSGILPAANHFPWNDAVPVLHIPCRSLKRLPDPLADTVNDPEWQQTPATFFSPLWLEACHVGEAGVVPPECAGAGFTALQRTTRLMVDYTKLASESAQKSDQELALGALLNWKRLVDAGLTSEGQSFLKRLVPIAHSRKSASTLAAEADKSRGKMMTRMAACAFVAALFFHCFSHWHFAHKDEAHDEKPKSAAAAVAPEDANTGEHAATEETIEAKPSSDSKEPPSQKALDEAEDRFALVFIVLALATILYALASFWRYQRSQKEWLRFDARALAEGLRVQFYWSAIGSSSSVAGRYMHRQKGELDWIRNAISCLSFPYSRWENLFNRLPESDQRLILEEVIKSWVGTDDTTIGSSGQKVIHQGGQRAFFRKSAARSALRLHQFHTIGWGLTWAGILQVALFPLWKAYGHDHEHAFFTLSAVILAGLGVLAATIDWNRASTAGGSSNGHHSGLLNRLVSFGPAAIALWVSALIAYADTSVPHAVWWMPGSKDLWIILTGAVLVAGAIAIAWSEKSLLSEHARQYRAMHDLFRNAGDHLQSLLIDWSSNLPHSDDLRTAEPRKQIQETLIDLGKEALDENSEWLVLHRSRPFEPFLAG
ncbi:MAG: hypothetical protein KDN20_15575 [Verrucomicrobiae bacterium]|nr:hypothetical protein [Verrucomicrobiae bacterium]